MTEGDRFIDAANRSLEATYEEPMSLAEYVERAVERPSIAAHAAKYLLDAIEAAGTRTVIEEGEQTERYRFFDDPENDGEHAVLGNTAVLNAFVDDLRSIAAGRGKAEKIIWFDGPTATGKSELKRCLINGLREYSKSPEGRRYTIEWNVQGAAEQRGLSYGDSRDNDEDDWYESPVQTHPLSVFPPDVRAEIIADCNATLDDHIPIQVGTDLDPFSREAYEYLEEQYRRRGRSDLFSAITDPQHLRVKNYVVDVGQGIGVLHSEDEGQPKERLVGSWMRGMLQELDSRGRKNPQAFSYDGVLSQGNGLLTVVEDAGQHADLLQKLLNVPDEGRVKLDKGIGMDVDTLMLIISNPDLEAQLNQHAERDGSDPLKALKRRLDRHEFTYLTNLSLEAQLIRRELTDQTAVWEADRYDDLDDRIRDSLTMTVRDDDGSTIDRELAPHAIEAAAMYSVVTRLSDDDLPEDLDLVQKALLFDRGYLQDGDQRRDKEDFAFTEETNGRHGIPVTYTRDVIAELLQTDLDRNHPELPVETVVMPRDVLNQMIDGLNDAPVFSPGERAEYESRLVPVKNYVFDRQETDVIEAITYDSGVSADAVETYVEHVYAWSTGDPIENDRGERVEPDALKMKLFEIEQLGRFDEDDYHGNRPGERVEQFREEQVITALNRHAWEQRGEDFAVEDVDLTDIPVIESVLETSDWDDVARLFEDLDPEQWDDPPANTETAAVKERTIAVLVEEFGYTESSAELTSRHVMGQVSYKWD